MYIYLYINFQIELKEKYHQRKPRASINEQIYIHVCYMHVPFVSVCEQKITFFRCCC